MRDLIALLLALALASTAFAGSARASTTDLAAGQRSEAGTLAARSMFLSPNYQQLPAGNWAAFTLEWSGYGAGYESFALYYEGGGQDFDVYTCWSNCFSGRTNYSHQYTSTGTRYPVAADQYGGTSNRVTVYVY